MDPADRAKHRHVWLEWLGLEQPPPDADSWVPVVAGLTVDNPETNSSTIGSRLVDQLGAAGITARQATYEFYNITPGTRVPGTSMVDAVAVGVHDRDLTRAVEIATTFQATLGESKEPTDAGGISDAELTRLALEAGPPPAD